MEKSTVVNLAPRVRLTHVQTKRFKTAFAQVYVTTPLRRENYAAISVLQRVLQRGTVRLGDLTALQNEMDDMYGASLNSGEINFGESRSVFIGASYVDDDIVGDRTQTARVFALLGELITSPATDGGVFRADYVETEKANVIQAERAVVINKPTYASHEFNKRMFDTEEFGAYIIEDEVNAITPENLYAQYRKWLGSAQIDLVYCGASEIEDIEIAAKTAFATLFDGVPPNELYTQVLTEPPHGEPRVFEESAPDAEQSVLLMGYRLGKTMLTLNYAALEMFSQILAGTASSKLFRNVREKLHLCYSISAGHHINKGTMRVMTAIDGVNRDAVRAEILAQIDDMARGEITDEELQTAKRTYITELQTLLESAGGIAVMHINHMMRRGLSLSPEEFAGLVETVTREEVVEIAQSLVFDTEFFLSGKGGAQ
ncbi:MAG: insulinase family protein [Oscillospiraceae bacterium]|jgi:predicted Zn-dependent peptidase|nr:insulinase family protein [Oscillospiraceae bacterium]